MAQKSSKALAARNTARLNTTLALTLSLHALFLFLRALLHFPARTFTRGSSFLYVAFSAPQLLINVLVFERGSRPRYVENGSTGGANKTLRRAGDDLDAKGLTEYLWDVTYWTYLCLFLAAVFGDKGWWAFIAVPIYSAWAAWATFHGMRGGMQGLTGADGMVGQDGGAASGGSKRQAKMEKRGGTRVQYR